MRQRNTKCYFAYDNSTISLNISFHAVYILIIDTQMDDYIRLFNFIRDVSLNKFSLFLHDAIYLQNVLFEWLKKYKRLLNVWHHTVQFNPYNFLFSRSNGLHGSYGNIYTLPEEKTVQRRVWRICFPQIIRLYILPKCSLLKM